MSLPTRTILGDLSKQDATSASHPLFYTRQRSHYLDRLTQQVTTETQLPTVDLRRNMRVDHYLNQYNGLKMQQDKQRRVQNTLLHAKEFQSVFQQEEGRMREEQRAVRENRNVQDILYKNYVEEPNFYQPAQRDRPIREQQAETILALGDPNRMKELYLLDLQIGKLKEEERIQKTVKQKHQSCQNNTLLGRLSSSIISSYMVYFDQIYALLIDEILEEEVIYLNHMEAEYKVNKKIPPPTTKMESRQTIQMMELVRSLQDLCDD